MSPPGFVYPHALPWNGPRPWFLHPTAGIAHNWALDFMAPGGTYVVAPEAATISRWSGHDPKLGEILDDHGRPTSVYGWSMYLHTRTGIIYFLTHLDRRYAKVGDTVRAGDLIGRVGHWPKNEGRSHSHLGVTHPRGETEAKAYIKRVANAIRVNVRGQGQL